MGLPGKRRAIIQPMSIRAGHEAYSQFRMTCVIYTTGRIEYLAWLEIPFSNWNGKKRRITVPYKAVNIKR